MIAALRDAAWLTPERERAYGLAAAVLCLALVLAFAEAVAFPPEGTAGDVDFVAFHAAARLALEGPATAAWDPAAHAAARDASLGGPASVFPFLHPPTFLLVILPLGLLPYFGAMACWLAVTGAALLAALRAWGAGRVGLAAALLSPAAVLNAAHGQTGFLAAALLAVAGLGFGRRPWLAGLCLALLAVKPQFGLLIGPALAIAGCWPVILWTGGFLALTGMASLIAFGPAAWLAFLEGLLAFQNLVRAGALDTWKLQSIAAFAAGFGLPEGAALAAQAAGTVATILVAGLVMRRCPDGRAKAAVLAAGLPLATPYILLYDLCFLLLPVAWIVTEAHRTGFRPWEKTVLVVAFAVPGVALFAGLGAGISVSAPVAAALLAVLVARIRAMAGRDFSTRGAC